MGRTDVGRADWAEPDEPLIRIGGCRRSSTTLTQRMCAENFIGAKFRSGPVVHKHGVLQPEDHNNSPFSDYVFATKNPWSYIISMRKWARIDQVQPPPDWDLENTHWGSTFDLLCLGNWAAKNQAYLRFSDAHPSIVEFVRAEDWIQQPVNVLRRLKAAFELDWKTPGTWKKIEKHPSPRPEDGPDSYDPAYYTEARYMDEYTEDAQRVVRERLDDPWIRRVVEVLGYDLEPPGWDWTA